MYYCTPRRVTRNRQTIQGIDYLVGCLWVELFDIMVFHGLPCSTRVMNSRGDVT